MINKILSLLALCTQFLRKSLLGLSNFSKIIVIYMMNKSVSKSKSSSGCGNCSSLQHHHYSRDNPTLPNYSRTISQLMPV